MNIIFETKIFYNMSKAIDESFALLNYVNDLDVKYVLKIINCKYRYVYSLKKDLVLGGGFY